jgi:predicted TIM-barrel fold metal-dependent hydrolase
MMNPDVSTDAAHPGIGRVLAAAARHSFPVNLLCWGRLDQVGQMAARHPETRLVIDHLGLQQPFEPPAPAEPWAELPKLLALAAHDNIVVKISGACTLSPFPTRTSGTRSVESSMPSASIAACGAPTGRGRSAC